MKTASQLIKELGLDEAAEVRKLITRSRHGWKRGKDPRVFPGQPNKQLQVRFGPLELGSNVVPHTQFGYSADRAQNDLFRIAAAPNPVAEYVALYTTRNHLK